MDASPVPGNRLLLVAIGFVLWSVAFVTLYATNAIGCAFGWPEGIQRGVIVGLLVFFFAVTGGYALWTHRHLKRAEANESRPGPSLACIALYAACAAFAATIGSLIPGLAISMCI